MPHIRSKQAIPTSARRLVAIREKCAPGGRVRARCFYCGAPGEIVWHQLRSGLPSAWVSFRGLELDHVKAESAGGESVAGNLVLACRRCNRSKGARTKPGHA